VAGPGTGSEHTEAQPDPLAMIARIRPSADLVGVAQSLERICRAAVDNLALVGAAVRLLPQSASAGVIVAAEGLGSRLGDIEFDVGEGPGTTAYALSRPVLVSDLAGVEGEDWPGFQVAATEHGVAAVFAFPLHIGAVTFGTLELFAEQAGPLTRARAWLARAFAEIAVEVLLDGGAVGRDGGLPLGLLQATENRTEVAQAQGMVMIDLGVSLGEAMVRLRAHAFAQGLSLSELARSVVGGYVLPTDVGPETGMDS
jgi:hypothetical protein